MTGLVGSLGEDAQTSGSGYGDGDGDGYGEVMDAQSDLVDVRYELHQILTHNTTAGANRMIPYQTIAQRLTNTTRNLETWRRTYTTHEQAFNAAWGDMRTITKHAERAYTRLHDSLPGIPSGGDSRGGSLGDPTGAMATQQAHPAVTALERFDRDTETLENATRAILYASTSVKLDWIEITNITKGLVGVCWVWGRESDILYCKNCLQKTHSEEPVARGQYKDLCRKCGDWRGVNGVTPSKELLFYLHRNEPIPRIVLDRYKAVVPRSARKKRRKRK